MIWPVLGYSEEAIVVTSEWLQARSVQIISH